LCAQIIAHRLLVSVVRANQMTRTRLKPFYNLRATIA
jgi:hypothetical protein